MRCRGSLLAPGPLHAAELSRAAAADYLLGRLARREGRWEEAADLLRGYFLGRLRADGCRAWSLREAH